MGCYGLGLSRILAASVEVLSTEKELRWPDAIVPFTVCIVCPKEGSREAEAIGQADLNLYDDLIEELNLVRYLFLLIFILLWEANLHVYNIFFLCS
jgi:prolyl-tRNA synthetase